MKRIQDVIQEVEDRLFVGREQELELMENTLLDKNAVWRLLHFYGPAGIGKTTLLRAFIRKARNYEIFYFDQMIGFPKIEEFIKMLGSILSAKGYKLTFSLEQDNLHALAEFINELALQKKLLIFIFDSYENWTLIDDWLREIWLPMLVPEVRLCSAGHLPLKNRRIISSGWDELIYNIEIHPLHKNDVKKYASLKGIKDIQVQDKIEHFSNGVPLTISLACEVVLTQGPEKLMDSIQTRMTIGPLIEKLFQDMKNELSQKLLDIACLLWRFDQDLLAVIAEDQISNKSFLEFCQLPFITVCDRGWTVHDVVRKWIKLDIAHRAPEKYKIYRNKALKELRKREMAASDSGKINLSVEKLYLYENEWIQNYLFKGHGEGVSIRTMRMDDVPIVKSIYRQWCLNTVPYLDDDTNQENLIIPLLKIVPSAFSTLWYEEKLVGFHSFVPINEITEKVFLQHPIYAHYFNKTKRIKNEFLIWIGGILPGYERQVMGVQLRHLLYCFTEADQILGIGSHLDLKQVIESMGFEHVPAYDYKTQNGGLHWHAVQLNLREEDLFSRLDKLLDTTSSDSFENLEEMSALIKNVLVHFDSLEQHTNILNSSEIILRLPQSTDGESYATILRKYIKEAIDEMIIDEPGVEELQQILKLAYIQKIGSHEIVARRLNLSISTYYRHLKKAIQKLTITLSDRYLDGM